MKNEMGWDPDHWTTLEPGPCRVYLGDGITVSRAEERGEGVDLHLAFVSGMPIFTVHVLPGVVWIGTPLTEENKRDGSFPLIVGISIPRLAEEFQ